MVVQHTDEQSVGIGQVVLASSPARLSAVLGSCVGVALYHQGLKLGMLAHVVLPDSAGRSGPPGKFADTAIPHMVQQLEARAASRGHVVAKIVGGGCMFGTGGPLQIGDANVTAVVHALGKVGIPIHARDVGGTKGRRITFDCATGNLIVQIVGNPPKIL